MLIVLSTVLALLALLIVVFALSFGVGSIVQAWRARRHVGIYRVRIGPASEDGRDGVDLESDLRSLSEARERARDALVAGEVNDDVAFILAARDDGEWDVVDRVDAI